MFISNNNLFISVVVFILIFKGTQDTTNPTNCNFKSKIPKHIWPEYSDCIKFLIKWKKKRFQSLPHILLSMQIWQLFSNFFPHVENSRLLYRINCEHNTLLKSYSNFFRSNNFKYASIPKRNYHWIFDQNGQKNIWHFWRGYRKSSDWSNWAEENRMQTKINLQSNFMLNAVVHFPLKNFHTLWNGKRVIFIAINNNWLRIVSFQCQIVSEMY